MPESPIVIEVRLGDRVVWAMDAPPGYALARDWALHARARAIAPGLTRAVRDAEMIRNGRDPERPSEKAIRLAAETRR